MKNSIIIIVLVLSCQTVFAATNFKLTKLDGTEFDTAKLQSRVMILFWATWCSECKEKMQDELPKLSKKPGVSVLTINIDKNIKRAIYFVEKRSLSESQLPVLRDESRELIDTLGVSAVPHWAIYKRASGLDFQLVSHSVAFDMEKIEQSLK